MKNLAARDRKNIATTRSRLNFLAQFSPPLGLEQLLDRKTHYYDLG